MGKQKGSKRSKETISHVMSCIHKTNTRPEELVRKYLFSKGIRYRKNDKRYPGCPDIVLPKYKTIVFVNGCFWHMHEGCPSAKWPKSNTDYWIPKLTRNRERDVKNHKLLQQMGWRVLIIWECELKADKKDATLCALYDNITKGGQY